MTIRWRKSRNFKTHIKKFRPHRIIPTYKMSGILLTGVRDHFSAVFLWEKERIFNLPKTISALIVNSCLSNFWHLWAKFIFCPMDSFCNWFFFWQNFIFVKAPWNISNLIIKATTKRFALIWSNSTKTTIYSWFWFWWAFFWERLNPKSFSDSISSPKCTLVTKWHPLDRFVPTTFFHLALVRGYPRVSAVNALGRTSGCTVFRIEFYSTWHFFVRGIFCFLSGRNWRRPQQDI